MALYEIAQSISVPVESLLRMDKRRLDATMKGFRHHRETMMNDMASVGHAVAGKIAEAVWNSRRFSKPIKPFKLSKAKKDIEHFRDIDANSDINPHDNKQLVQSFENQFKAFLAEGRR